MSALVSFAAMAHPYRVTSSFTVRSYETDSYAHLNNGVYVNWFEHGRLDYLRALGFSYDGFAARSEWFVVARTEIDFRRALDEGDASVMTTWIEGFGRTSVRFRQRLELQSEGGGIVSAEAATVMAFRANDGATPVPDDFRSAVEAASDAA